MVIKLDEKKITGSTTPLVLAKKIVTRMLTRDLFAVANLLVIHCSGERASTRTRACCRPIPTRYPPPNRTSYVWIWMRQLNCKYRRLHACAAQRCGSRSRNRNGFGWFWHVGLLAGHQRVMASSTKHQQWPRETDCRSYALRNSESRFRRHCFADNTSPIPSA